MTTEQFERLEQIRDSAHKATNNHFNSLAILHLTLQGTAAILKDHTTSGNLAADDYHTLAYACECVMRDYEKSVKAMEEALEAKSDAYKEMLRDKKPTNQQSQPTTGE
jgi:hypothetical protein